MCHCCCYLPPHPFHFYLFHLPSSHAPCAGGGGGSGGSAEQMGACRNTHKAPAPSGGEWHAEEADVWEAQKGQCLLAYAKEGHMGGILHVALGLLKHMGQGKRVKGEGTFLL